MKNYKLVTDKGVEIFMHGGNAIDAIENAISADKVPKDSKNVTVTSKHLEGFSIQITL